MSNSSVTASASVSAGFPVLGILGLIFVLAKVFEIGPIAAWSWWWVLAPFWLGFAIVAAVFAVFFIGCLIAAVFCR